MVSDWVLFSLLPLIGSNAYAIKKIGELQDALTMRETLLDGNYKGAHVVAGGTVVQTFEEPIRRVRITAAQTTRLTIEGTPA